MAEQKILISININDKQAKKSADGVAQSLTKVQKAQEALNFELSEAGREYAKLTAATNDQKLANNLAAKSAVDMAKGMKQGRAQSGLNNAILLETGRLASDASYGFTAIANNLSQVTSLFGSFVKTQGGVIASFKALGKSLLGSGGFLIAIQLIISFGPQIFAFFERLLGFTRELQDAFKGASGTVKDSAGSFETYTRTLQDATKSQAEQKDAIKALNKEFPDYVKQLKDADLTLGDLSKGTEEAIKITDLYRESIIKLAIARQAQVKIDEAAGKIIDLRIEQEMKALDNPKKIEKRLKRVAQLEKEHSEVVAKYGTGNLKEKEVAKKLAAAKLDLEETKNFNAEEIKEQEDRINKLIPFTDIEIKENKRRGGSRDRLFKASKDFTIKELDFNKQIQKSQQNLRQSFIKDESFKINETARAQKEVQALRRDDYIKQQEERKNNFIAAQKVRLDNFLAEEKDGKKRAAATKIYDDAAKQAEDEFLAAKSAAYDAYNGYVVEKDKETKKLLTDQSIKDAQELQAVNRQKLDAEAAYLDEKNRMNGDYSFFQTERNIKTLGMDVAAQQAVVDSHAIGTIEREQAELRLFELKKQLNSEEQALAEQKFAFFNQQYTAITDALSQTFAVSAENETIALEESYGRKIAAAEGNNVEQERLEKELAVKKDKIARKQFKIDKAMKIGRALMDTYQSGILAFGSQLIVGDPTSPVRGRIAQAIALATGLANVANIARQKYQSNIGAGGSGGSSGGSGGTTIQAPDFNVVGESQTSQLAQTVAGQQAKPVKAFVVGKDISTQQELDRNITNTASFG